MSKKLGLGTALSVQHPTTSYGAIGQIRGLRTGEAKGSKKESTTLDTTGAFHTYLFGLIDAGEATFDVVYDPGSNSHKYLSSLLKARAAKNWKVTYPTTAFPAKTFSAAVIGMGEEIPLDDLIMCSVTLGKTGDAGFTST